MISRPLVLFCCLLLFALCGKYTELSPKQIQRMTVAGDVDQNLVATYYPASYRSSEPKQPVILFDSLFVHKRYLHQGAQGGFIAWLNRQGYSVWLIHFKKYQQIDLKRTASLALSDLLVEIEEKSGHSQFHIGGLSLGGQVWVHFFNSLKAEAALPIKVSSLFFMATPFDFMETGSFYSALKKEPKSRLKDCAKKNKSAICGFIDSEIDAVDAPAMLNYFGLSERKVSFNEVGLKRIAGVPLVMITGKIDSIAGEESLYPEFDKLATTMQTPPLFFVAGRANGFEYDYDHFSIWHPEIAVPVFAYLGRFLSRDLR